MYALFKECPVFPAKVLEVFPQRSGVFLRRIMLFFPGGRRTSLFFLGKPSFALPPAAGIRKVLQDFPAVAGGTFPRLGGGFSGSPGMTAAFTVESPSFHLHASPFNVKPLAENNAFGNLSTGAAEDVPEGLPGDVHVFRRMLMIEPFQICEAEGFKFVESQDHHAFLSEIRIFPFRKKGRGRGEVAYYTVFFGSWHRISAVPSSFRISPTHGMVLLYLCQGIPGKDTMVP